MKIVLAVPASLDDRHKPRRFETATRTHFPYAVPVTNSSGTPQRGNLYSTAGVTHPGARPAIPEQRKRRSSRVERDRELFGFNPMSESPDGFSAGRIYLNIFIVTMFFGIIDALLRHHIGLLTAVPFAVISIVNALRVTADKAWAAWTAPPIVFAVVALITSPVTGQSLGKFPLSEITGLILVLMANTWAVLATTGICWFIGRRKSVKVRSAARRERRMQANIDVD